MPILVNIDQEMRLCNRESARRRTHWNTDRRKPIL